MAKLRPNLARFFDFISAKNEGQIVSDTEIRAATGWAESTLDTHRNKNALDPFLAHLGSGRYRVRRNGATVSRADVSGAFTQIRPSELVLSPGTHVRSGVTDYELIRELGRGAVAHVWEATSTKGSCAVKVVNPRPDLLEPSNLDNVKRRFGREARNGIRITHPHIVRYLDSGEYKGHPFLVMELADESLASSLTRAALSISESLHVVECCADGLRHLHEMKCVHRDVKPPNILRFGDGFVLGDLGIVLWSDMNPAFTSAGTITKAAVQLGSWYYMAPEQRQSPHNAIPASDIYELGVSWYEMLAGSTPDPAAVAARALTDPTADDRINGIIRRMLSYSPGDRPSADSVYEQVKEWR